MRVLLACIAAVAVLSCVSAEEPSDFGPASALNTPHGGTLVDLLASPERAEELIKDVSPTLPSVILSRRQLCDVEMLLSGAFSPLTGFMDQETYRSVLDTLRLPSGLVWPMPISLDLPIQQADKYSVGDRLALRDQFFNLIAIMTVTDKYVPDKTDEAAKAFGTTDQSHPAVDYLFNQAGEVYLGGTLEGVRLPQHFDFNELRFTPAEARAKFQEMGWGRFVAFQTRNPMHRAHIELTRRASREIQGRVFINPVVGMTKPGDVDYATRVRCYQAVLKNADRYYGKNGVFLGLLPLAMRMAGPREALWHSIIRKNYGATHFVVGRDHAGCKSDKGEDFYGPYDAQELVAKFKDEIGITIVEFKMLVYAPDTDSYIPINEVPDGTVTLKISGTKFRKMMADGDPIPEWFSDPDVIKVLMQVKPPKPARGFTVFFTGLSGSGKTTIAAALVERLTAANPARPITVLDGDVVRTHLSKGLGFSIADRNANIARIGWVAAEVNRHRGLAIACPIAPFESSRHAARELAAASGGGFVLVHAAASLEVCMARDVKGLYARALRGEIRMTGHRHPYEYPSQSELVIDSGSVSVSTSVDIIIGYLTQEGYLADAEAVEVLKAHPEAVTAGVTDPSSRLCTDPTSSFVIGLGAVEAGLAAVRSMVEKTHTPAVAFDASTFKNAESGDPDAHVPATATATVNPDGSITSSGDVSTFDQDFLTGTASSSALDANSRLEAAWWLFEFLREEGNKSGSLPTFTAPRLLVYAHHILRFDPCARAIAVDASEADVVTTLVEGGVDTETASRYAETYAQELATLAADHPDRVLLVELGAMVDGDATELERVRRFVTPIDG